MKKVLIITYYWPPSGGAGVQRWLKFSKYLPKFGWQPIVLTVDEEYASYPVSDDSHNKDVGETIVYKTKSKEILQTYARLFGKDKLPQGGGANSNNNSFKSKVERFVRGNFFLPDPRRGWNKYAYAKAVDIIKKYNIDTVVTTSPPHSTQLIGLKLKQKLGVQWIADFRDPWTSIFHYNEMYPTPLAKYFDKKQEKRVLLNADKIITVGDSLKEELQKISRRKEGFEVIHNGFDSDDFVEVDRAVSNENLHMVYTGTMADSYGPEIFFDSLNELKKNIEFQVDFYGSISSNIQMYAKDLNLSSNVNFNQTISHSESISKIQKADILLLIIPNSKTEKSILTGKLFEYLAAKKPILCIGPKDGDAAKIIEETNSGETFDREDLDEISKWILKISLNNSNFSFNNIEKYSRENLTEKLVDIL